MFGKFDLLFLNEWEVAISLRNFLLFPYIQRFDAYVVVSKFNLWHYILKN